MTSKADDFDVRYDDAGRGRRLGTGGTGAAPGGVDYDLGYADNGWDTEGFRSPAGGASDRTALGSDYAGPDTVGIDPVGTGTLGTRQAGADQIGRQLGSPRRSRHGGPAGPGGPRGPRGPGRGRGGPPGRAGRAGRVKIKGSWWRHWTLRKALGVFLGIVGGFIILGAVGVVYIYNHTPVPTEQMAAALSSQSTVYAADGRTVIGRFGTMNRQLVNYNQIPKQVIYSVLAAEDRNFFNEGGVSPSGILRAAYEDTLGSGNFQGGSTITQEFVRQYYKGIGTAQTSSRKVKEIFVAMKIARQKSKQWIMENYLNTIYLGQSSYGIGAAAQTYFNIPVANLSKITWSQAALIAGIIQQPSTYPLPQFHAQLVTRWQYVRDGLLKMGWIDQNTYNQMQFPKFGNYTPHSYGTAVWDPYVMNEVQIEMQEVYGYTPSDLYNRGYKIVTTIDPAKMTALYQAVIQQEAQMTTQGESLQSYMHVGAVLEDPATGAIEAMYPGPGYPGAKYNGVGKVITPKMCTKIHCEVNMAVYNREQVGSSFKPYILATAVAQGMNVKTSMLDGQDFVCIPPDTTPQAVPKPEPAPGAPNGGCTGSSAAMSNDSTSENGAFNPQDAMTNSVNTAYADLWHYVGGSSVAHIAKVFGVNTDLAGITAGPTMLHEAGVALGQGSLSVSEQATMLAALDNGGVAHPAHIVKMVEQGGAQYTPKLSAPVNVFNGNAVTNANMDTQVQYAMQKVAYSGTAAGVAGMSDGRQIISKTGTTNTAQSAFFIGAIPQQALAVALFTDHQSGNVNDPQTLNGLGGITQTFGGTWPAAIWHAYAQNMFLPLPALQFPQPVFTGATWNLAPKSLEKPKKKPGHDKKVKHDPNPGVFPSPTATCAPGMPTVACNVVPPGGNGNGNGNGNPNPNPTGVFGNLNLGTPEANGPARRVR